MFVQVDDNQRLVCMVDDPEFAGDEWVELPVPSSTVGGELSDWKLEEGKLVYSPTPPEPASVEAQGLQELLPVLVQNAAGRLTDSQLLEVAGSLPVWAEGQGYRQEDAVRHATGVYRAVEDHVSSQASSPSAESNDVWLRVGSPHADGVWDWLAPESEATAYQLGERAYYQGKLYQSTEDNNLWPPDQYGWVQQESEAQE